MVEFLKEIAGPFAIFLTSLAALLTWVVAEKRKEKQAEAAQKQPLLTQADIIARNHAPNLIADAITDAGRCLCEKLDEIHTCDREDMRDLRKFQAEIIEHIDSITRALTVLAKQARLREDREGGLGGSR